MRALKAIGHFLSTVIRSCYDLDWYRIVRSRPWTASLAYLAKFCLLISVTAGLMFAPSFLVAAKELRQTIGQKIPDGAEFAVSRGVFSANVDSPLNLGNAASPLIIDASIEGLDLPENELSANGVVIGRNSVFVRKSKFEQRVYSLKEFPDVKITKAGIIGAFGTYAPPLAALLAVLVALGYFIGLFVSSLVYAVVFGVAAFAIGRIAGTALTYRQWRAFGCVAVTLPTLVGMALMIFGVQIPFAFSFIFFAFAIAMIVDERGRQNVVSSLH